MCTFEMRTRRGKKNGPFDRPCKTNKGLEVDMFCSECGAEINDKAVVCPKCGVPVAGKQLANNGEVNSHMVGAILQLIVCIPAGIVPLVYACRVNSKLAQGDIAGAQEDSKKAKFWINLGTAIIGALIVIGIIANVVSSDSNQQRYDEQVEQY